MAKYIQKRYEIPLPHIGFTIYPIFTNNVEKCFKNLGVKSHKTVTPLASTITDSNHPFDIELVINLDKNKNVTIASIAHEILHAISKMWGILGNKIDIDEHECYMMEYLLKRSLWCLDDTKYYKKGK